MSVEYVCKLCGGKVSHMILTSYPPIDSYTCQNCGRSWQEQQGIERIPI